MQSHVFQCEPIDINFPSIWTFCPNKSLRCVYSLHRGCCGARVSVVVCMFASPFRAPSDSSWQPPRRRSKVSRASSRGRVTIGCAEESCGVSRYTRCPPFGPPIVYARENAIVGVCICICMCFVLYVRIMCAIAGN